MTIPDVTESVKKITDFVTAQPFGQFMSIVLTATLIYFFLYVEPARREADQAATSARWRELREENESRSAMERQMCAKESERREQAFMQAIESNRLSCERICVEAGKTNARQDALTRELLRKLGVTVSEIQPVP